MCNSNLRFLRALGQSRESMRTPCHVRAGVYIYPRILTAKRYDLCSLSRPGLPMGLARQVQVLSARSERVQMPGIVPDENQMPAMLVQVHRLRRPELGREKRGQLEGARALPTWRWRSSELRWLRYLQFSISPTEPMLSSDSLSIANRQLLCHLSPNSQKNFKKEYHNRAERERTRKINNSIQEIRGLTGCVETDKVSILESATKCIADINAGTYRPSPRVKSTANRAAAAASSSPTAISATTNSPPGGASATEPATLQPDAFKALSPIFDGEQLNLPSDAYYADANLYVDKTKYCAAQ